MFFPNSFDKEHAFEVEVFERLSDFADKISKQEDRAKFIKDVQETFQNHSGNIDMKSQVQTFLEREKIKDSLRALKARHVGAVKKKAPRSRLQTELNDMF